MFYLGYYGKALIATFQGKASKTILSIKLLFQVLGGMEGDISVACSMPLE